MSTARSLVPLIRRSRALIRIMRAFAIGLKATVLKRPGTPTQQKEYHRALQRHQRAVKPRPPLVPSHPPLLLLPPPRRAAHTVHSLFERTQAPPHLHRQRCTRYGVRQLQLAIPCGHCTAECGRRGRAPAAYRRVQHSSHAHALAHATQALKTHSHTCRAHTRAHAHTSTLTCVNT